MTLQNDYSSLLAYIHHCMDDNVWKKEILANYDNHTKEDFTEQIFYFSQSRLLSMYEYEDNQVETGLISQWIIHSFALRGIEQVEAMAEKTGDPGEAFYQCSFAVRNGVPEIDNLLFAAVPEERLRGFAQVLAGKSDAELSAKGAAQLVLELLYLVAAGAERKVILRHAFHCIRKNDPDESLNWTFFLLWLLTRPEYQPLLTDPDEEELVMKALDFLYQDAHVEHARLDTVFPLLQKLCGNMEQLEEKTADLLALKMSKLALSVSAQYTQEGCSGELLEILGKLLKRNYDHLLHIAAAHANGQFLVMDFFLVQSILQLAEQLKSWLKKGQPAGKELRPLIRRCEGLMLREDVQNLLLACLKDRVSLWLKKKLLSRHDMEEEDFDAVCLTANRLELAAGERGEICGFWNAVIHWLTARRPNGSDTFKKVLRAAYPHIRDLGTRTQMLKWTMDCNIFTYDDKWIFSFIDAVQGALVSKGAVYDGEAELKAYRETVLEFLNRFIYKFDSFATDTAVKLCLDIFIDVCRSGQDMEDYAPAALWYELQKNVEKLCGEWDDGFWAQVYIAIELGLPKHLLDYVEEYAVAGGYAYGYEYENENEGAEE